MKPSDLTNKTQVDEAMPMGAMSKLGQTIASKLPTFAPQTASKATGKLETGKIANQLMIAFQKYLGQTGQEPTKSSVVAFLKQQGYPTSNAEKTMSTGQVPALAPQEPQAQPTQQQAQAGANTFSDMAKTLSGAPPTSNTSPKLSGEKSSTGGVTLRAPGVTRHIAKESDNYTLRTLMNIVSEAMAEPKLTSKQVSAAILAAAQEAMKSRPAQQTQTQQNIQKSQPTQSSQPGFMSSLLGKQDSTQSIQQKNTQQVALEFSKAVDAFIKTGGKLTPQMKQKLQTLINNS